MIHTFFSGVVRRAANTRKYIYPTRMMSSKMNIGIDVEKYGNLQQIRAEIVNYDGGAVALTKNESNGIAFICLDRADRKNALSGKMMADLSDAVTSLQDWTSGKGVILYGKGDMFCSGGDHNLVKNICTTEGGYKMSTFMQDTVARLRRLRLPSVAIVQGSALGGGAELTLATDFRLMTESATIAFVQGRMGVGTGFGGGYHLTKLIGSSKALDLLLTCRKVSSSEAMSLGLATGVITGEAGSTEERRLQFAVEWLQTRIEHLDPTVVQTLKNIIYCEDLEEEKLLFTQLWGDPEHLSALTKNIKHK